MTRILIFAKLPQPGFAKTRLIPLLGAEGAASLARYQLHTTLSSAMEAQLGPVELCVTPTYQSPAWRTVPIPAHVTVTDQREGDLGARMAQAAQRNQPPILLIGTDCLEMSPSLLQEAADALRRVDAVLYATKDGGYAVLGMNRFHPALFDGMAWGTATVAKETAARIRQLGWSLQQGTVLHDLDEPQDLLYACRAGLNNLPEALRLSVANRPPSRPMPPGPPPTEDPSGRTASPTDPGPTGAAR
ncbi:MAG: TIGR04282 family arsenosugar biosynthesis glycosyltransferase [Magnetococcus sp. MYC-9]